MILRGAAARRGRSAVAPVSKYALRHLSTTHASPSVPTTGAPSDKDADPQIRSKKKKRGAIADLVGILGADSAHEHRGAAWSKTKATGEDGGPVLTPAEQFAEFKRIQKHTRSVGGDVESRYRPTELISNPPGPEDVTLELLMASQTHLGHNKSLWNPANSRYIFGVRDGIHVISLETTAAHLRRASRVVEEVAYNGGLILFAGTRKNQMEIVTKAASMAGACHLFTRWTPGAITNRDKILKTHETKVVDEKDQRLTDFDKLHSFARPLVPDLVICLNPLENYTMLYECGLASVPTIGIIDTNADPSWVTYTIPANDDSLRSAAVIAGVLGRAGQAGQKRRMAEAKKGKAPWRTSREVTNYMDSELAEARKRRKEVMGQQQEGLTGFNDEESAILNSRLSKGDEVSMSDDELVSMMGQLGEDVMAAAKSAAAAASAASSGPNDSGADVAAADVADMETAKDVIDGMVAEHIAEAKEAALDAAAKEAETPQTEAAQPESPEIETAQQVIEEMEPEHVADEKGPKTEAPKKAESTQDENGVKKD